MRWMWGVVAIQSLSTAYGFFALGQVWVALAHLVLAAFCSLMALAVRPRGVFYVDEDGVPHTWSDAIARVIEFCESGADRVVYVAPGDTIILIINPRALKARKRADDLEIAGKNHKRGGKRWVVF